MEGFTLTVEMIDKEISNLQSIIDSKQSELDKLIKDSRNLTERIEVFKRLEKVVKEDILKRIAEKNITMLADDRFKMIPDINNVDSTIKQFSQLIEYLEEIKKDI